MPRRIAIGRNWRLSLASVILLAAAALAQAAPEETTIAQVQGCEYLQQVTGDSGYGKQFDWRRPAKYAALKRAEKLAATHIVWTRFDPAGGFNGMATADAYRCKRGE